MNDLKFAFRQLLKNPGFTAVAVLALAMGIGANTAIFSLINPVLFRTISGVREPTQLLAFDFRPSNKPTPLPVFSYPDFVDLQQGMNTFTGMAAYRPVVVTMGADEQASRIQMLLVTPNWFSFLGVRMLAGRGFAENEGKLAGADPVAVISESLWKRQFNTDPSILGKEVRLNGHDFTIIGVAAPFRFEPLRCSEAWVPLTMHLQIEAASVHLMDKELDALVERRRAWVTWLARLKPGLSLEQAQTAVGVRARQIGEAYGPGGTIMGYYPLTVVTEAEYNRRQMRQAGNVSVFLFALSGLVLVVACANLANLLLARASTRRQEIAVRLALGATRSRLVRQLITEGILLALAGGTAGLLLSSWTTALFTRFVSQIAARTSFPVEMHASLDWDLLAFGFALALAAGVALALAPALQASRPDLLVALKGQPESPIGGRRRLTWRNVLVIGQIALCFLLLVVAALFTRGLQAAQQMDLGFQPEGVLAMPIDLEVRNISKPLALVLFDQIRERLGSMPAVKGVAFARHCQGDDSLTTFLCDTAGVAATNAGAYGNVVSPDYFRVLQTPILRGREFTLADASGPPRVIVNETLAAQLWPGHEALGQQVRVTEANFQDSEPVWADVIGVAKDAHYLSAFQHDKRPFLYRLSPRKGESTVLMIRLNGDHRAILPVLRSELQAIEKRLPIYELKPLSDMISAWRLLPQMGAILVGSIGLLGLFLASLGLYGLLAYMVGQRTKEFGIRLALGAQRSEVVALVMRQGLSLVLLGSCIGLAAALAGTRVIRTLLFGVSPLDLAAFAAVCLLLTGVALLACYLPARRATKTDPMVALRYE